MVRMSSGKNQTKKFAFAQCKLTLIIRWMQSFNFKNVRKIKNAADKTVTLTVCVNRPWNLRIFIGMYVV